MLRGSWRGFSRGSNEESDGGRPGGRLVRAEACRLLPRREHTSRREQPWRARRRTPLQRGALPKATSLGVLLPHPGLDPREQGKQDPGESDPPAPLHVPGKAPRPRRGEVCRAGSRARWSAGFMTKSSGHRPPTGHAPAHSSTNTPTNGSHPIFRPGTGDCPLHAQPSPSQEPMAECTCHLVQASPHQGRQRQDPWMSKPPASVSGGQQ